MRYLSSAKHQCQKPGRNKSPQPFLILSLYLLFWNTISPPFYPFVSLTFQYYFFSIFISKILDYFFSFKLYFPDVSAPLVNCHLQGDF